jgi:hypothetical protein
MDTLNSQNSSIELYCDKCDYVAKRKSDLVKHFNSKKHNDTLNDTKKSNYPCMCGKIYKFHSGYYRHKKKCDFIEYKETNNDISNTQLTVSNDTIMQILNDNKELKNIIFQQQNQLLKQQEQISELIPKVGNNNNNNNTQNNKFNINVFLNEQCKDAINMSDFIKSLHVTLDQLDFTKQNGLADGISKTIIDNMSKLSIYERPMHCTDTKRETLYIKEDNEWSKDKAKEKVKNVIKKTSSKNYNALMDWKKLNPDFMKSEDKTDYFTKTISTIGKSTDSIDEKVIKKLCKETYIKDSI